ncbi:MAG: hypothetical protein V1815_00015 [Candidatus Woesearchaeota archaeon]
MLINENKKEIKSSNNGYWYKDMKNIEEDILLNKYAFENYKQVFNKFSNVTDLEVDLDKEFEEKIIKLISKIKND